MFYNDCSIFTYLTIHVNNLSSKDHSANTTFDLLTCEWSPTSFRVLHSIRDCPLSVHVNLHVCVGLIRQVEYLLRVCMQFSLNILRKTSLLLEHQLDSSNIVCV